MNLIGCSKRLMTLALIGPFAAAGVYATPSASQPARATEFRPILSADQKRDAARQVIDRFVEHVKADDKLSAQAKSAVVDGWKQHRSDEDAEGFLLAGLSIVSEPFKTGLSAIEAEKYADAEAALKPLAQSADAYLSLNASGLLARALVEQDRLEDAEPVLKKLAENESDLIAKTFLETEIDFMLGYAQLSNLHYDEASESLQRFEYEHPDAPDRFRLPAHQMLTELKGRRPEQLGDISDLMVYSGRRLSNGEPGKPVQISQGKAVDLLTKLIAESEQREQQQKGQGAKSCKECQGKGCSKCQGGPKNTLNPKSPANKSALPGGQGQIGQLERSAEARPGEEWGKMRPEERERVLQSLRRTFPSRYRQLVEQYYKQLAKEH